jgi:hypothetical protein
VQVVIYAEIQRWQAYIEPSPGSSGPSGYQSYHYFCSKTGRDQTALSFAVRTFLKSPGLSLDLTLRHPTPFIQGLLNLAVPLLALERSREATVATLTSVTAVKVFPQQAARGSMEEWGQDAQECVPTIVINRYDRMCLNRLNQVESTNAKYTVLHITRLFFHRSPCIQFSSYAKHYHLSTPVLHLTARCLTAKICQDYYYFWNT